MEEFQIKYSSSQTQFQGWVLLDLVIKHNQQKFWTINSLFKSTAHLQKELSKIPRKAVSSAVSSCVQWNFCEFCTSRGREENICRV